MSAPGRRGTGLPLAVWLVIGGSIGAAIGQATSETAAGLAGGIGLGAGLGAGIHLLMSRRRPGGA